MTLLPYWHKSPDKELLLKHAFETPADAKKWWKKAIECLANGERHDRRLAKKLKHCRKSLPCRSPACPKCSRKYRIWFTGQALKILHTLDDNKLLDLNHLKFITIVPIGIERELEDLISKKYPPHLFIKRMKDRLRNQFIRSSLKHLVITGGIEGDFDVETSKWEFHFHLIVAGLDENSTEWKLFLHKNGYSEHALHGSTPVQVNPIDEKLASVTSYCLKSYFSRKEKWIDSNTGKKKAAKFRLKPTQQRIALCFLDSITLEDRAFFFNTRRYGCELRITPVSEKLLKNSQNKHLLYNKITQDGENNAPS